MLYQKQIMADKENASFTQQGLKPIYQINSEAKILIIGQAPGKKVQDTGILFNDKSGERLRKWLGVDSETFYDGHNFAIIPMDFYYPGKAKSGDKPPRKTIAEKWHPKLIAQLQQLQLIILIGNYAQHFYLNLNPSDKLTTTVKNYKTYLPKYFPIVHPSPRNNIWLKNNPWFETEIIPDLQKRVQKILNR
ncbi:uracil-DNA glycosylase family protein [Holzapfeliella sp. JNUCC 80]